ncbi:MAG: hypothetical protein HF308_19795, partial [Ignavibacteria bacterium]|nr:hypothetical protein [Ignavibacteria bacterium]
KIKAVGTAEADVITMKIKSMESGNYAAIEVAKALATSGFKLVPDIVAGGSGSGSDGNSLVNTLLAMIIKDKLPKDTDKSPEASASSEEAGTQVSLN